MNYDGTQKVLFDVINQVKVARTSLDQVHKADWLILASIDGVIGSLYKATDRVALLQRLEEDNNKEEQAG